MSFPLSSVVLFLLAASQRLVEMFPILLLLTYAAITLAANDCTTTPIFVDFHDRCVDNCFTVQYGLFIGFGTPFQNESLWPSLSYNETTLAGVDYCSEGSSVTCENQTHGVYSPQLSVDYQDVTDYNSLDADITRDLAQIDQVGQDTVNIYTHYFDPSPPNVTHLSNHPVTVLKNWTSQASPWFGPGGLLGLGPSSTLLTGLFSANLISSRSFGLYVGTAYPRAGGAINGSLTLGGYDSGRFTGDAIKYPLSPPSADADSSPYKVSVSSVSLTNTAKNNETTILSSTAFDAYLTTGQYEMSLPDAIAQQFIDLTSSTSADAETALISGPDITPLVLPAEFEGMLTISLASGLNITFSTNDGTLRNTSSLTPLASPSTSSPGIPKLGTSLLAHLYLTTLYPNISSSSSPGSFFLSPALPSGKYVITQPLCPSASPSTTDKNTMPIPYSQPTISSFQRNGIIGAILGGVIGGIGLVFSIWWCLRRYLQRKQYRTGEFGGDEFGVRAVAANDNNNDDNADADARGVAIGNGLGKRVLLKGILKPSTNRHHRSKKLDKKKNPITAYYAHQGISTVNLAKKTSFESSSSSSSSSRNGTHNGQFGRGEEFDMVDLQAALPPPHEVGSAQGHCYPPNQRTCAANTVDRSKSPSPIFSPDDEIPRQYQAYQDLRTEPKPLITKPNNRHPKEMQKSTLTCQ